MRRTLIRLTAMVLMLLLVGTVSVMPTSAKESNLTDWMGELSDELPLSSISIPGTHDSCSQYITPKYFLRCQNTGIREQLEMGYRYLDIRVAVEEAECGNTLKLIHAFGDCRKDKSWFSEKLYIDDVLKEVYAFLEEHPTETVIFCVKPENEDDDPTEVSALMNGWILQDSEYWFTENRIPELGEVRGRVVYASRFKHHEQGMNFYWQDQGNKEAVDIPYSVSMINTGERLWVQDRYKYNNELKWDAFTDDLGNCQANEDTFSLNFLSTSGSGTFSHPKQYAGVLNDKFKNYELTEDTCYGVLIFDFADAELAQQVIATNE
ncbi:MAG: hypothetical protein II571_05345 [Lachnospiraceae bacterium]|nr:hypothetical protein [Lachnospiraceae bacterium]